MQIFVLHQSEDTATAIYARYLQGVVAYHDEVIVDDTRFDTGAQSDDWDAAIASIGIISDTELQIVDLNHTYLYIYQVDRQRNLLGPRYNHGELSLPHRLAAYYHRQ